MARIDMHCCLPSHSSELICYVICGQWAGACFIPEICDSRWVPSSSLLSIGCKGLGGRSQRESALRSLSCACDVLFGNPITHASVISAWLTLGESVWQSPGCLSLYVLSQRDAGGDLVTMLGSDPQPLQVHRPCPSTIVQLPHWCLLSFPSCFTLISLR